MATKGAKPLRFTALHLENWRNFSLVDVALQQRVFLVGPNAAGKSNLLDALRFLHDLVAVGGGFQEAVGKRGGVSRLRSLAARRYPDIAVPQLAELALWRDEIKGAPHLRGKYDHWRPQGAWQTEEQFSDGTLRLIGLLWAILDGAGPLLLEEPELSLHPEVVRFLPQMFARIQSRTGRQILTSTHSTDLLRDEGIGLDEVILLRPSAEGTTVATAGDRAEARTLLDSGLSMADVIVPLTRPERAAQLSAMTFCLC